MRCPDAVERMMTADPRDLAAPGDTPLGRHLRQCARCRAIARTLTAELDTLRLGLERLAASDAASDAASGVGASPAVAPPDPARGPRPDPTPASTPAPVPRRRRRIPRAAWVPLAAAAAVAAVLVVGRTDPTPEVPAGLAGPRPAAGAARVAVRPPTDRSAVVMETRNPTITIIWLYEKETP